MRVTKKDFDDLNNTVVTALKAMGKTIPELTKLYKDKGLSMYRMRWDILWCKGIDKTWRQAWCKPYNDEHIDTALRKIIGTN
jgi:hypothetical protein|tara:strand:- start:550 stop:795 length:246 start_codon:yes stop_codon:yes gene_type:complete